MDTKEEIIDKINSGKYILIDKVELAQMKLRVTSYQAVKKNIDYFPIENETWKPIKWAKGYFISDMGRVRREKVFKNGEMSNKLLFAHENCSKLYVDIRPKPNYKVRRLVHDLVADHFLPKKKDRYKWFVLPMDGNFLNPNVDNLKWASKIRNRKQRIRKPKLKKTREYILNNGTKVKRRSVLSTADCEQIFALRTLGLSQQVISKKIGCTQQMVSDVLRGEVNF